MTGGILALDLASIVGWSTCGPDYRPVTLIEAARARGFDPQDDHAADALAALDYAATIWTTTRAA